MKTKKVKRSVPKKLRQLRDKFYIDEKTERPNIRAYGIFNHGMTEEEIKEYLMVRANTLNIKKLYKKFNELCMGGTATLSRCPICNKEICLTYRCDVERFADKLLLGIPTYFD